MVSLFGFGRRGLQRFKLDGVQEIGTEIGRGSYASVVELRFRGLKCVGKKLYRDLFDNATSKVQQGMLQRFEAECEILSELKHPNIVQFLGVDFEKNRRLPTLVLEFVHTTLSACLERYGKLPNEVSYSVLDDVATALCYLHGHNPPVLHRDLSANNVLLTTDMRAKVSDLGVAKILDLSPAQMTQMTTCPGTPAYMPPEALDPHPTYDVKLDSFSYGILMLHIFSGRWPLPSKPNHVCPDDPNRLVPLSEAERREEYFQEMGKEHPLKQLTLECLSNNAGDRPDMEVALERVREILVHFPPTFEDKLAVLNTDAKEKADLLREVRSLSSKLEEYDTLLAGMEPDSIPETAHIGMEISKLREEKERISSLLKSNYEELSIAATKFQAQAQQLAAKNQLLAAKQQEIALKQKEITAKDEEVKAKDQEIAARDRESTTVRHKLFIQDAALSAAQEKFQLLQQRYENAICMTVHHSMPHLLHVLAEPEWKKCADMPVSMALPQIAQSYHNEEAEIYIGGGIVAQDVDDDSACTVYKYKCTPGSGSWMILPPCPVKWYGLCCIAGVPVVVGGCRSKGEISCDVFDFNEQSQQWVTSFAQMPTKRYHPCVISYKLGVAVCGGMIENLVSISTVEVFLTKSNKWYSAAPLPTPSAAMRATVIASSCFLLGGYANSLAPEGMVHQCYTAVLHDLFDISSTDVWQRFPDVPVAEGAPGQLTGALVVVGGGNKVHAYCPSTRSWLHIGNLPVTLRCATAITLFTGLFVFGGYIGDVVSQQVFQCTMSLPDYPHDDDGEYKNCIIL